MPRLLDDDYTLLQNFQTQPQGFPIEKEKLQKER